MATTTNFGWETPDDTDLVQQGAAAMRTLGNSIDTSFVDLKGGTTGQVLSKASATDLDFTWVTDAAGDITGVTAGTGISGGGTSGTVTVTNSMATAIDAKGDLVVGTGADTFARLGVGTNGQALIADSAEATGLKWATAASGGMTSIASGSLSGSSLSLTSISGSYKDLRLVFRDYNPSAAGDLLIRANSGTDYTVLRLYTTDTSGSSIQSASNLAADYAFVNGDGYTSGDNNNSFMMDIYDYADTTSHKLWRSLNKFKKPTPVQLVAGQGSINTTSAITSLTVTLSAGTYSGGTYILYGVN
jgi:hypothetical protein